MNLSMMAFILKKHFYVLEKSTSDGPHLAVVISFSLSHHGASRDEYMWKCSVIGEQSGRLKKHQLKWFQSPQQKRCKEETQKHLQVSVEGTCKYISTRKCIKPVNVEYAYIDNPSNVQTVYNFKIKCLNFNRKGKL